MLYWPVLIALTGILLFMLYLRGLLNRKIVQAILLLLVIVHLFAFGMDSLDYPGGTRTTRNTCFAIGQERQGHLSHRGYKH